MPHPFGTMRHLGFAFYSQAHHDNKPNRVRYPADESFTSHCSPPRLTATQLRSVTRFRPNLDEDFHLADTRHLQAHECGDLSPLLDVSGYFGFENMVQPAIPKS